MKSKTIRIIALILIVAGVGIFAYPWVSSWWNERASREVVAQYAEDAAVLTPAQIDEEFEIAYAYNLKVSGLAPYDPFSEKEPVPFPEYAEILAPGGSAVMAYIEVPSIDLSLPVYHGVADSVLARGIGHMPTTALPVGGEGTHCVLVGHNAIPSRELFTHLDKVKKGDAIIIHVLDRTLGYRVDQITVAKPEDTEALLPVAGKDYLSLVSCTPYGVNSHRIYVRGVRDDSVIGETVAPAGPLIPGKVLVAGLVTAVIMTGILIVVYRRRKRLDSRDKPGNDDGVNAGNDDGENAGNGESDA
ncbi:MAG: class C sortase [Clostridiales Family XIII bacterium]|jgi:sortase A|nr:class C sortase [Clostridiales Family XIII bacterium]